MTTTKKRGRGGPPKIERNKKVCDMRKKGYSYQQIADKFGISQSRAFTIVKDNLDVEIALKIKKSVKEPDDLISFAECARIAGVSHQTITYWSNKFADFPTRYVRSPHRVKRYTNVRQSEFKVWMSKNKNKKVHRPKASVSRRPHKKREMRIIVHPVPQPQNGLGSRFKRFLGINS